AAAEHEAHAHNERDRQHEHEDQGAAVADEFEVPRVPHGEEPFHHARSSLPVSSRKRSSRLGGRMRRSLSGTRASMSLRSVPSRSSVAISTRSLAAMTFSASDPAPSGNSWRGSSSSPSSKCSRSRLGGVP